MRIGEVATRTGLTVDAIRFYERRGLLLRAPRSEGGFRLYSERDVESLRFLRQMQAQGFSLDEIRELLSLRGGQAHACEHVRDLLASKLAAVHAKQHELRKLERELGQSLNCCRRALRKKKPGAHRCPVLERAPRRRRLPA
ncbi:MAG: heavy metal-responsive transcriptional regulator [Candidatus Acidiferrales bacterium]